MGQNENRQEANALIDKILKDTDEEMDYDLIVYNVTNSVPVGERAIKRRLEILHTVGKIVFDKHKNTAKWVENLKKKGENPEK